jgi:hypothetical protein
MMMSRGAQAFSKAPDMKECAASTLSAPRSEPAKCEVVSDKISNIRNWRRVNTYDDYAGVQM